MRLRPLARSSAPGWTGARVCVFVCQGRGVGEGVGEGSMPAPQRVPTRPTRDSPTASQPTSSDQRSGATEAPSQPPSHPCTTAHTRSHPPQHTHAHRTLELEVADVGVAEALDKVLLDAARRRDERVDHRVLREEADLLAHARGDEVACACASFARACVREREKGRDAVRGRACTGPAAAAPARVQDAAERCV